MDEINQANFNSAPSGGTDISKTTITVLVLLTLIISVIGTWTVLNEVNNVKVTKASRAVGQVSLTVSAPPDVQQPVDATGKVTLNILGESS